MKVTEQQLRRVISEMVLSYELRELPEPWEVNTKAVRMKLPPAAIKLIEKEFAQNRDNPDLDNGDGRLKVTDVMGLLEKMGDALALNPYIPEHRSSIQSALNVFFSMGEI
jgi:hypothetical protein